MESKHPSEFFNIISTADAIRTDSVDEIIIKIHPIELI